MSDERLRLVAELQNKASAELRKLQRDMGNVKPSAGMAQAKTWFDRLSNASETANKSLRPLSSGLGMIGAGGLAAGLSIAGLAKQFTDLAKALPQLKELSRQTGMSATEIERLKAAAGDLNVDPSKMQASLSSFSEMMVQFHRRSGTLYEEMANHGAAGLAEKIRQEDPGAAYRDILKWLDAIPEAQRRAGKSAADAVQIQRHWAQEAFGDADMAQLVSKGMKGFEDAYAQASRDVHEITAETIAAAEKLDRSIASFERTWKDFETTVGPTVFDNLRHATDDFREVFETIKGATTWYEAHKDHPVQDAGNAVLRAIDDQAAKNSSTEDRATRAGGPQEKIMIDLPGAVSRGIHALIDRRPASLPAPRSASAAARPIPPEWFIYHPADDDRTSRARFRDKPSFHPADDDRASRARAADAPDRSLDGFVVGQLDRPVLRLVGTLKTAAAELGDGAFRPAAFHPAALGASLAAGTPGEIIAAAVKAGTLAAFREWAGMQDPDGKGGAGAGGGGFTQAAFHPGGGSGGGGGGGGNFSFSGYGNKGWEKSGATKAQVAAYIRHAFAAEHIDPSVALRIASAEGLHSYVGDHGTSFGAFQLHYGGSGIRGMNSRGLGDRFTAETGLDARDPTTFRQQIDFAAKIARREGWGAWHGRFPAHVGLRDGIGTYNGPVPSADDYDKSASNGSDIDDTLGKLHLAGKVTGVQCVALANAAVGFAGSVKDWRKGVDAASGTLVDGTPIATFLNRDGSQSDRYAGGGIGTEGANRDHAAVFRRYLKDEAGKIVGMTVSEQSRGRPLHLRNYMFGRGVGEQNGSNYNAILGPDGKPLGGSRNPLFRAGDAAPFVSAAVKLGAAAEAQTHAADHQIRAAGTLGGARRLLKWMNKGSNLDDPSDTPISTYDMRDPKFAPPGWKPEGRAKPAIAPLPAIAPEPPRRDDGAGQRADDPDESHLHVHLHQDGRVRSVRSGPGLKLHLDTGRTLTQFA